MSLKNIISTAKLLRNELHPSASPATPYNAASRQWFLLFGLLMIISGITHFGFLTTPDSVVFDEFHFGKFTTAYCCTGENFFDIHPPLAKLLIAGAAKLGGYQGGFDFKQIGETYRDVPVFAYRVVPAIAGFALTFILFVLIRQLGGSDAAAFFAAALYTFDNAFLVQTRFILLDGVLLLGIFAALSAYLAAMRTEHVRQAGLLTLSGVLVGLAVGTKFTGLTALGLIMIIALVRVAQDLSAQNIFKWARSVVWVVGCAMAVYLFSWFLHFQLLDKPGYGDAFYHRTGHFFTDLLNLHHIMFSSNAAITTVDPDASPWWSWPLMTTPPFYWAGQHASIYLLGNPVVWWGTSFFLIVIACIVVLAKVTRLSWRAKTPPVTLWIPFVGYLIATLPYVMVKRPLFMYHYLPSLLFALLYVVLWLDSAGWIRSGGVAVQRKSFFGVLAVTIACFVFLTSVTYGYPHPSWYAKALSFVFPYVTQ